MRVMAELTVGALAKRTGLTVRALHHYDEIGLLSPSGRSEAGYRLYADADVERLQRIVLLRGLGIPLEEIGGALDSDPATLLDLLERHAAAVQARADELLRIRGRVTDAIAQLRTYEHRSIDDAMELIGAASMLERYFDDEQRQALRARGEKLGPERIRAVEARWPELIATVRREMQAGTSPGDLRVLALAEEWQSLLDEFVNGRWDIAAGAGRMMHAEPSVRQRTGLDAEIMDYVAKAMAFL
jgi:DNA-binding transcriptional MerR regulator